MNWRQILLIITAKTQIETIEKVTYIEPVWFTHSAKSTLEIDKENLISEKA